MLYGIMTNDSLTKQGFKLVDNRYELKSEMYQIPLEVVDIFVELKESDEDDFDYIVVDSNGTDLYLCGEWFDDFKRKL